MPQDISVISRDDDPFLSFLVPSPTRYVTNPHALAKALLRPVIELLDSGAVTSRAGPIMPGFVTGDSFGPARR